jgi:hypothetical protein
MFGLVLMVDKDINIWKCPLMFNSCRRILMVLAVNKQNTLSTSKNNPTFMGNQHPLKMPPSDTISSIVPLATLSISTQLLPCESSIEVEHNFQTFIGIINVFNTTEHSGDVDR